MVIGALFLYVFHCRSCANAACCDCDNKWPTTLVLQQSRNRRWHVRSAIGTRQAFRYFHNFSQHFRDTKRSRSETDVSFEAIRCPWVETTKLPGKPNNRVCWDSARETRLDSIKFMQRRPQFPPCTREPDVSLSNNSAHRYADTKLGDESFIVYLVLAFYRARGKHRRASGHSGRFTLPKFAPWSNTLCKHLGERDKP